MNKISSILVLIALVAGFSLFSCYDSESRLPVAGDATVIFNLGLKADTGTESASIIDRVLRLFTRDAVAATAPAVFGNISIRVSGSGIGTFTKDCQPTGVVSLTVPGGGLRTFDVTAFVATGDPSAAKSFHGTSMANVPAGGTVYVPVVMELYETKLLVPDMRSYRLVLLDMMNPMGWNTTINAASLGIGGPIYPYDVDYDSRGRIYIANWVGSGTDIIRIDDLNGTNIRQFNINIAGVFDLTYVTGIAIDRKRDILYCISSTELFKVPLSCIEDNTMIGVVRLDNHVINGNIYSNLFGIDVDVDGNLYIVNSGAGGGAYITKYNPVTDAIIYQLNTIPGLNAGYDIKVEKPYLFLLNSGGAVNYKVIKYQIISEGTGAATYMVADHYGRSTITNPDYRAGMFYGPRKFVGIRNDGFIIIDNNEASYLCKLISMGTQPTLGITWTSFGEWGTSQGQFKFYCSC